MKQFYVKLQDGSVKIYHSISQQFLASALENDLGFSGFTFLDTPSLDDLKIHQIERKMNQIRAERDSRLAQNDKAWMIASKKGESTTALESEAQSLRDLPALAQSALALLETVEEIEAYNAFGE